jgi:hypothetical protein
VRHLLPHLFQRRMRGDTEPLHRGWGDDFE